ncbi:unnamed protein product [Ectocarpus sp. 6 AP-2014]
MAMTPTHDQVQDRSKKTEVRTYLLGLHTPRRARALLPTPTPAANRGPVTLPLAQQPPCVFAIPRPHIKRVRCSKLRHHPIAVQTALWVKNGPLSLKTSANERIVC